MFTKNAFKRFVKQCLAEVIVEDGAVRKNAMFDKDKKCTHPNGFEFSGKTPGTGYEVCRICGTRKDEKKPTEEGFSKIKPTTRHSTVDPKLEKAYDDGWKSGRFSREYHDKPLQNGLHAGPTPYGVAYSTGYSDGYNGLYKNIYKDDFRTNPHATHESAPPQEQWKDTFGNKMSGEMVVAENSGLILTPTGHDDEWSRPVYKGSDGKIYVDVNCGNGTPSIHSISDEGEPEFPIKNFKLNPPMTAKERFPNALCPRCKNSKPELMKKTPTGKQSCTSCHWEENPSEPYNPPKTALAEMIKECVLEVLKENLGEGFDPWSNGGPNGPDETGGNPYKKWNADMRKLEEDGDGFNSMKGDNPAATMKAQMFPYADQNDAMRQLETKKTPKEVENNDRFDHFKDAKKRADELGGMVFWWVKYYIVKPEEYNESYGYAKYVSKQAEAYFKEKYRKHLATKKAMTPKKWANGNFGKLQEDGRICTSCNGSGEGMADGTRCSSCGGSGDADKKWGKKSKERDPDDERDYRQDRAREWGGMD